MSIIIGNYYHMGTDVTQDFSRILKKRQMEASLELKGLGLNETN